MKKKHQNKKQSEVICFDSSDVEFVNYQSFIYIDKYVKKINNSDIENNKYRIIKNGFLNFELNSKFFFYKEFSDNSELNEEEETIRLINFTYFHNIEIKPSGKEAIITFKLSKKELNNIIKLSQEFDISKELDKNLNEIDYKAVKSYCNLSPSILNYIDSLYKNSNNLNIKDDHEENYFIFLNFYIYYIDVRNEAPNFLKLIKFIHKAEFFKNNLFLDIDKNTIIENKNKISFENIRDYQKELFKKAVNENSIVFLETGLGKTLISILLANTILDKYNNNLNGIDYIKTNSKKAIFLFKNISLLIQQANSIRINSNYKVLGIYGGENFFSFVISSK